jgi:hypothetical protein
MIDYKTKYIKYKNKYINLKNKLIHYGGISIIDKNDLKGCYTEIPSNEEKRRTERCRVEKCTDNLLIRINNSIQNKGYNIYSENSKIFIGRDNLLKQVISLGLVELLHFFMEQYNFKINDILQTDRTLLQYAVRHCKCIKLFKYLLDEGVDPLKSFGRMNSAKDTLLQAIFGTTKPPPHPWVVENQIELVNLFNQNISKVEDKINLNS